MRVYKNRVQVMLDDETLDELKKVADKDNRAVSDYLRILIREHLNNK